MKNLILVLIFVLPSLSHALCIKSDNVNLRAKPDQNSKVTWVVGKNMPLLQIDKKGPWIQVKDFEGEKHWVHARNITHGVNCVVVKAKSASLRSGPGQNFGQTELGVVRKYATFQKTGRDEEWIKVRDNFGQTHWTHERNMWEPRHYSRITF